MPYKGTSFISEFAIICFSSFSLEGILNSACSFKIMLLKRVISF